MSDEGVGMRVHGAGSMPAGGEIRKGDEVISDGAATSRGAMQRHKGSPSLVVNKSGGAPGQLPLPNSDAPVASSWLARDPPGQEE